MAAKDVIESQAAGKSPAGDFEVAKCDCCGLTEECTAAYVAPVRQRYGGRWICGEAIKDESRRRKPEQRKHLNGTWSFMSDSNHRFLQLIRQRV